MTGQSPPSEITSSEIPQTARSTFASTDFVGDPGLGVFEDDETPGNGHIPLLANSPAIDAANQDTCPKRDQLGQRVNATGHSRRFCDIGAVEFIP